MRKPPSFFLLGEVRGAIVLKVYGTRAPEYSSGVEERT